MQSLTETALNYLDRGFSIIPVRTDKKPLIKWEAFQKRKATPEEIREWWGKWPDAMIGIVTGLISGIVVIDVDDPDKGMQVLSEYLTTCKVPTARTPRGGFHLYFKAPEKCPGNSTGTPQGVDFRGHGGYIIAPPSQNGTGKAYTWLDGLSLDDIEPPPLPEKYIEFIRANSFSFGGQGFAGKMFQDGNRDNSLFHTALCLLKGGMPREEVYQVLEIAMIGWGESPDPKWIWTKIDSADKRIQSKDRNLTQEIRDLISMTSGQFRISQVYRDIPNIGPQDKTKIRVILARLVQENLIERIGKEDGVFRRIETEEEVLDLRKKSLGEFPLKMPFCLEGKVKIFPKSIITVGAAPDGGKTAYLLNVAVMNRNAHKVTYFTSEMGLEEFQDRADKIGLPREEWVNKIRVVSKGRDFSDSIRPEGLNIVDYLDLGADDFPRVGEMIRHIWEKLTTGICFVGLQKNYHTDLPQGGLGSIKLARLSLSLDSGILKIVKAKGWRDSKVNPVGLQIGFKLVEGWRFIEEGSWIRANEAIRVPDLFNQTEKQYKQGKKRMGKRDLTNEFNNMFSGA